MQFSTMKLSATMKLASLMHFNHSDAPATNNPMLQHVFDAFRLNQSAIDLVQQLTRLLADIQRHRACSLAILSGNDTFETQVQSLQQKINARLSFIDNQPDLAEIIDSGAWQNVLGEWRVVGYGWRSDNVLHNFELHSHLLEKILNIVRDTGRWVLRSGSYSEEIASHYLDHEVFEFVFSTHLYQIETLGRLRGLGTHAANSGCPDHAMALRIEYQLQCAWHDQRTAREFFASRSTAVTRNIPALFDVQRSEQAFDEWTQLLGNIVNGSLPPSAHIAAEAYALASTVIDARLAMTEQILAYLRLAVEEMLETVLEETARLDA